MNGLDSRIAQLSPAKRKLLQQMRRQHRGKPASRPIGPRGSDEPAPLSFAQQRLWFLDRLQPGSSFYNVATRVRLSGPLDEQALEQSLRDVIVRHEALRTTFTEIDGEPRQIIHAELDWSLRSVDLSQLAPRGREQEIARHLREEARRPFDLDHGPLIRGRLLHIDSREHLLLLTLHHIVCDGWSMGVLGREVNLLYEARRAGRVAKLPDLSIQYADYSQWQRERIAGDELARQLDYWRRQLHDAPTDLDLPTDYPRPAVQSFRGGETRRLISRSLTDSLLKLAAGALLCAYRDRREEQPELSCGEHRRRRQLGPARLSL